MIDLMENQVVGPLILEAEEKGRREGRKEGRQEGERLGMQTVLVDQITAKFGEVPDWALVRIQSAAMDELQIWVKRVLKAASLDEILLRVP